MVEEGSALLDSHRVTASPPRSASRQTDSESPLLFSRPTHPPVAEKGTQCKPYVSMCKCICICCICCVDGGQLASTMCPLSAHHPCLSLCQIPKIRFSLYITLQVSMRIVAGSVCMVFSRYAIAEYSSSQFAPCNNMIPFAKYKYYR